MKSLVAFLLVVYFGAASLAQSAEIMLGVLAPGGDSAARERWQPTADYLQGEWPHGPVKLVPLTLDSAEAALAAGELDFLLTNPGHYQSLLRRYGLAPLVSLRTDAPGTARTGNRYGAVIFAKAGKDAPTRIADLRGKRFAAVAPDAFGGWRLAEDTLIRHGIRPARDLAELRFMGFPQSAIVDAVLEGRVDAGTVRTGVLEAMIAAERFGANDVVILNPLTVPGFDLMLSTTLVPEWLIVATPQASPELRRDAAMILLAVEPDHPSARGRHGGWIPPQSQAPVLALTDDAAPAPARSWTVVGMIFLVVLFLAVSALSTLVMARKGRRPATAGHVSADPAPPDQPEINLTPREVEVLDLVARGLTSKEIARTLSISPKTVEFHRHNLMQKFDASNMADLVRRAGHRPAET